MPFGLKTRPLATHAHSEMVYLGSTATVRLHGFATCAFLIRLYVGPYARRHFHHEVVMGSASLKGLTKARPTWRTPPGRYCLFTHFVFGLERSDS